MTPRRAVTAVFFVDGALYASWASRIPALSDHVGADSGVLGLILLAPALAAALTMPRIGGLLAHTPSRRLCTFALAGLPVAVVLPALMGSPWSLAAVLLGLGAVTSTLDVAMNAQGIAVERGLGRPILSSLHAAFSLGGFTGAGGGALAVALGLSPLPHLLIAAAIFGIPGVLCTRALLAHDADPQAQAPALSWRALPRRLLLIGVAGFFALVAEGGAADWSAKLVRGEPAGSAALGAIAYAVFSVGMAAGRLSGDRLWLRWGAGGLLRRGAGLASVGFTLGLVLHDAGAVIGGFLAFGVGLSGVFPSLIRAGSQQPGVPAGPSLAAVASVSYLGFLAGPPIIGGLAQVSSLPVACELLAVCCAAVAALSANAAPPPADQDPRPRRRPPAPPPRLSSARQPVSHGRGGCQVRAPMGQFLDRDLELSTRSGANSGSD